jgi:carboxyl-terminal processing protease
VRCAIALAVALSLVLLPERPAAAAPAPTRGDVSLLDLIETEFGYTTITDNYYRNVSPQVLLDGARTGIVAYLRGRGIADPRVGFMHARADGRFAVPAIEQQIGLAIERYGARVNVHDLVAATIAGELGALHDPYSVLFTKAELAKFTTALDGRAFGGIGAELGYDDARKQWRIDEVFPGSPAAAGGVRENDELVAVDGTAVGALDVDALSAKLRGPAGSTVALTIERDGAQLPQPLKLKRAVITPPDVSRRTIAPGIGYVALRTFGPEAGRDVRAALTALVASGDAKIIFDLRGNGGGYESAAVDVASCFVRGPVVSMIARGGKRIVTDAKGAPVPISALVVLVDGDSASGSELVTGAIRDHHAGTIVGARTFGKGLVQAMFPLPDGSAIKLTTARYFTPDGEDIDRIGIAPNVAVAEPANAQRGVAGADPQLDRALALLGA